MKAKAAAKKAAKDAAAGSAPKAPAAPAGGPPVKTKEELAKMTMAEQLQYNAEVMKAKAAAKKAAKEAAASSGPPAGVPAGGPPVKTKEELAKMTMAE